MRPTPSPDGRYLAFVRRLRTRQRLETALFLQGSAVRRGAAAVRALDRDMQETWAVHGVYPNMDWTPDSKSVLFWAGGGIKRLDVASRGVQRHCVPCHGHARLDRAAALRGRRRARPSAREWFASRRVSPDGQRVVFEAFGRLWLRDVAGGEARR